MTEALKNLKVLNDYIIIKPFQQKDEDVTEGGLIVAKNPGDPSLVYHYAKVVGVGEDAYPWGVIEDDRINVGDVVYYAQWNAKGLAVVEDGYIYDPRSANYAVVKPEDIIAVVVGE